MHHQIVVLLCQFYSSDLEIIKSALGGLFFEKIEIEFLRVRLMRQQLRKYMSERFLPPDDPVLEEVLDWTVEDASDIRQLLEWLPKQRV